MARIKLVDLFNIKFEEMETKINKEIESLEMAGHEVNDVRVLGDSLKNAGVFIVYD
jgi:biotin operon repressor